MFYDIIGWNKKWRVWKFNFNLEYRSGKNAWGRFGGGWNYELGIQIGERTIILKFLIFMLRIDFI